MPVVYSQKGEEFHLKIREGDVGKYVFLCGDPGRCEKNQKQYTKIAGSLDVQRIISVK